MRKAITYHLLTSRIKILLVLWGLYTAILMSALTSLLPVPLLWWQIVLFWFMISTWISLWMWSMWCHKYINICHEREEHYSRGHIRGT